MNETRDFPRMAAVIPGFVIGVLWLAMALTAIWASARGYANERSGWGLGWGIVGFFLLAAALSALVGTWWHNFKVTRRGH